MAGRGSDFSRVSDSLPLTALPSASSLVTSTPRVQPARARKSPARLSDSATARELGDISDLSLGSEDHDSIYDTEWQHDQSSSEEEVCDAISHTALPSTSGVHDVSDVAAPVAIPSTSGVGALRGSLGDILLSPISATSHVVA
ncbi:hypothetical protein Pmani_012318 [Petrolisthes manimaculis]|uniref:Uncharacterized protein n=1 Tax=Petrolisthes manimaculis TaxID=1843537 RepID=A0AAE1PY41_9EUCA|nr:hypothetical protein Pmani_012318 [Petrolisthes manimaculis]